MNTTSGERKKLPNRYYVERHGYGDRTVYKLFDSRGNEVGVVYANMVEEFLEAMNHKYYQVFKEGSIFGQL
jgi:hypothetical protein